VAKAAEWLIGQPPLTNTTPSAPGRRSLFHKAAYERDAIRSKVAFGGVLTPSDIGTELLVLPEALGSLIILGE
jgi:hypothetical protein